MELYQVQIIREKVIRTAPSNRLRALVYASHIELYFGKNLVQEMNRVRPGELAINYRHVIGHLVRKPGAFRNYQYRDELFPSVVFRRTFDELEAAGKDEKEYLKILHSAAMDGEQLVGTALTLLLEMRQVPTAEAVRTLLVTKQEVPEVKIIIPKLSMYDGLLASLSEGLSP